VSARSEPGGDDPVSAAIDVAGAGEVAPERGGDERSVRQAALAKARSLGPRLRARAAQTDEERRLPQETVDELLESGLFGVLKPRSFGGDELGIAALVEVTAELAAACGSTGWVYGVLAGHGWLLNLFPREAQEEILSDPNALTATVFRLGGRVVRATGGFRLTDGTGKFCSGIDHASWVIVGNAVVGDDGPPEPRFFVVPKSDIEIVDDWFTVGMRGTGSRSIRIRDTFIPEHRSVSLKALARGDSPGAAVHPGALYRTPFQLVAPFSIIGAPLGIARGAVEAFRHGLAPWLEGLDDTEVAARSQTFARFAHAAAEIDAAYALVLAAAARIDDLAQPDALGPVEKARMPRDWAYAAQTSREAVARLFAASGGGATFEGSEIQRIWRDVNSASQHYAFVWDNAMSDFGRVSFGLEPLNAIPGKRR
jgi:3-hydroxy-9,10-secoandrosta-1,3,5(10)-triene-9,17-dione monooxygenase